MSRRLALLIAAFSVAVLATDEAGGQTATSARGSISVTVVDTAGRPFEGASVVVDSGVPRQTRRDGKLVFPRVVTGPHQIEVFAIGMTPRLVSVEVPAGTQAVITVRIERIQAWHRYASLRRGGNVVHWTSSPRGWRSDKVSSAIQRSSGGARP